MPAPNLLHLAEFAAVKTMFAITQSLGLPLARRFARRAATVLYVCDRKHRQRALRNLRNAYPDSTAEWQEKIAREAFATFAQTVVEAAYLSRFTKKTLSRLIELDLDPEAERLIRGEKPVFMIGAHIGNWEMCGASFAMLLRPITNVARPIRNPWLETLVSETRGRMRQTIIAKRGALREMTRALKRGECVGVIIDQNAGRHGVFVDYFGRPASTTPAAAALALRYDVPVIMAWLRREKEFPWRFRAEAPLPFPDTGDREENIRLLTQAMTSRIEAWVREAPGQWLWGHRRWKAKPPSSPGEETCRENPSTSIA